MTEVSANRLDSFLAGLLTFLDVGQDNQSMTSFNVETAICSAFSAHALDGKMDIRISTELRKITCNKTEFDLLIDCILSNVARHCTEKPLILQVNGFTQKNQIFLEFSDNGPGIAPQHHKRIFEPFETLNPRDQVEGSGIGLAIAAKIMRGWGGKISLQSNVGDGCKFIVQFPII